MAKTPSKAKAKAKQWKETAVVGPMKPSKSSWKWIAVVAGQEPNGVTCKVCHRMAKVDEIVVFKTDSVKRSPADLRPDGYFVTVGGSNTQVIHKSCLAHLLDIAPVGETIGDAWDQIRTQLISNGGI